MISHTSLGEKIIEEAQKSAGTWSHLFLRDVTVSIKKLDKFRVELLLKILIDYVSKPDVQELPAFKIAQLLSILKHEKIIGVDTFCLDNEDRIKGLIASLKPSQLTEATKRLYLALLRSNPTMAKKMYIKPFSSTPLMQWSSVIKPPNFTPDRIQK